jgi:hypothetical protein
MSRWPTLTTFAFDVSEGGTDNHLPGVHSIVVQCIYDSHEGGPCKTLPAVLAAALTLASLPLSYHHLT